MEEEAKGEKEDNVDKTDQNDEDVQKTIEQLLQEVAIDYRNYLEFDISKEQGKYYESIEGMLTKLEEFCGLVDLIRSDTNLCLNTTMPKIEEKCEGIKKIFEKIDNLEKFVSIVKENVLVIEERVNEAEKEVGGSIGSGIMKKLSSIVGSKKSGEKKRIQYEEPDIFNTDDYFPRSNQASEDQSSLQRSTEVNVDDSART